MGTVAVVLQKNCSNSAAGGVAPQNEDQVRVRQTKHWWRDQRILEMFESRQQVFIPYQWLGNNLLEQIGEKTGVFSCLRDKHEIKGRKSKETFQKFLAGRWKHGSDGVGLVMLRSKIRPVDDE